MAVDLGDPETSVIANGILKQHAKDKGAHFRIETGQKGTVVYLGPTFAACVWQSESEFHELAATARACNIYLEGLDES